MHFTVIKSTINVCLYVKVPINRHLPEDVAYYQIKMWQDYGELPFESGKKEDITKLGGRESCIVSVLINVILQFQHFIVLNVVGATDLREYERG